MIARRLTELKADHVLILAAFEGRITALECAMPVCVCPQGRDYFERKGARDKTARVRWAASPDRFPVPGRDGGRYESNNVRLAHLVCNIVDGSRWWNDNISPEKRARRSEWCRRLGAQSGAANLRKWNEGFRTTPEGRAEMARRGSLAAREHRVRGGQNAVAVLRERGFFESPVWTEGRQKDGWKPAALCQRWNINRGKACTCGRHN